MTAGVALTRTGKAFLPEFHEGSLTVQANTLPGTSLAKSDEIGRRVEQILLSLRGDEPPPRGSTATFSSRAICSAICASCSDLGMTTPTGSIW